MHSIVIIDFETTGIDPASERAVELGAILYSLEHRTVIEQFSTIIRGEGNAAEAVNKIPPAALLSAPDVLHALARLTDLVDAAEDYGTPVFMSHGVEFDRSFLDAIEPRLASRAPWVCSMRDVMWPHSKRGISCAAMAIAHDVPVISAHRALTDCTLIAKTIESVQRLGHDVDALIVKALRPKVLVAANTPKPWEMKPGEWEPLKEQIKAAGLSFDDATKSWRGRISVDDIKDLPFAVREVAA